MEAEDFEYLSALGGDPMEPDDQAPGEVSGLERLAELADLSVMPLEHLGGDAPMERLAELAEAPPMAQAKAKAKVSHPHRGLEAMAHARAGRAQKRAGVAVAKAEARAQEATERLQHVARNFPLVVQASGVDVPGFKRLRSSSQLPPNGEQGRPQMTEERAAALIRASFLAQRVTRGLGVRHERLICFAAELVVELREKGLADLLRKCAMFRCCAQPGEENIVCLGLAHESDSTGQGIAQHAIQRLGRASSSRLTTEVLSQQGTLHCRLLRVDRRTNDVLDEIEVRQDWFAPPQVILAKTSPFVLESLIRGMPFHMSGESWPSWRKALEVATDNCLLLQVGDKASSNFPAFRHVAAIWNENPKALSDCASCELHNLQNIKNMNASVRRTVGKMFSFGNIMKTASYVDNLCACLAHLCHTTVRRLPTPPPGDVAGDTELLLDALYDFSAECHKRGRSNTTRESRLLGDLREIGRIPLYELRGQALAAGQVVRVHHCWDFESQSPCCESQEETCERSTVALCNFHGSTAFDRVSLSRFTHVAKARKRLLVGLCHQRLFLSAAASAASRSVEFDSTGQLTIPEIGAHAEELGAGASDMQLTHRTRCARLVQWFRSESILYELAVSETAEGPLDLLQYAFFGRDGAIPTVEAILSPIASPIGASLGKLWSLLATWECDKHGPWKLLPLTGWTNFASEVVRREARAQVLGALVGIVCHYDDKFSNLPWSWWCLADPDCDDAARRAFCEGLLNARPCCIPEVVRGFLAEFRTVDEMMSAKAAAVIKTWAKLQRWTTKASEMSHAAERRQLSAAAAPGRALLHHSREHFLDRHRLAHVRAGGVDPRGAAKLKRRGNEQAPAGTESIEVAPDPFQALLPPSVAPPAGSDVALEDELREIANIPVSMLGRLMAGTTGSASNVSLPTDTALVNAPEGEQVTLATLPPRSGRGMNPYFLRLNQMRKEFKKQIGNRSMTSAEQRDLNARAKASYQALSNDERTALHSLYYLGVRRRREADGDGIAQSPLATYKSHFGMGDPGSVISPKKFCQARVGGVGPNLVDCGPSGLCVFPDTQRAIRQAIGAHLHTEGCPAANHCELRCRIWLWLHNGGSERGRRLHFSPNGQQWRRSLMLLSQNDQPPIGSLRLRQWPWSPLLWCKNRGCNTQAGSELRSVEGRAHICPSTHWWIAAIAPPLRPQCKAKPAAHQISRVCLISH